VRGTDPQGGEVNRYDCSDAWIPMLLIENSQQQRQTGAAVESFRNTMVDMNGYVVPPSLPMIASGGSQEAN
jgi:hypothetical protein